MKKQKLAICLFLAIIMVSYTLLGLSVTKDTVLSTATEITQNLFAFNSNGERNDYIFARYLKGLDESDSFILTESEKGGYAIFDKESMELIEYSDTDYSPFSSLNRTESYYAGPASYYKKSGATFQSLVNSNSITKEDALKIATSFKETFKANQTAREEKSVVKKKEELSESKSGSVDTSKSGTIDTTMSKNTDTNSTRSSSGNYYSANMYSYLSRKHISKYYFFINNSRHGTNTDNTCTAVAVQLLLAYNRWANDGRLIPYQPDENTQFLLNEPTDEIKALVNDDAYKATTSDTDTAKTSFFEYLKTIIPAVSPLFVAELGIGQYIATYAPDVDYLMYLSPLLNINNSYESALKQEVDSNRPALALILLPDTNKWHTVVVYGYQQIMVNKQPLNGLIAHFGWHSENKVTPSNVWFNSNLLLGYLTFQTTHVHQDIVFEYEGQTHVNPHVVECLTCGRVAHNNSHTLDNHHQALNSTNINKYHLSKCACGYELEMLHSFNYTHTIEEGESKHKRTCSFCGYNDIAEHFYKNAYECYYCLAPQQ